MSTYTTFSPCPQCGFEQAHDEFDNRSVSRTIVCMECGYYERHTPVNLRFIDGKPHYDHIKIERTAGSGALCYSANQIGFSTAYGNLPDGRGEIDFEDLKCEMANLYAEHKLSSYRITRWNPATSQVEVIAETVTTDQVLQTNARRP